MAESDYDLVVLGGGPGGYTAAIRAAQLGLKTTVVEREELGGVCTNWGCIPSKALLRNAEVVYLVREASTWGVSVDNPRYDMGAAIDRSRAVVQRMVNGVKFLLKKNKIDVRYGAGRLADAGRVAIDSTGETLRAKNVIVATGARSKDLPGIQRDGQTVITSREALALKERPGAIVIVGGGAIGVELAYFYNAYGARVTIVEMLPHLLPTEDTEVSEHLERAFKKLGIAFKTNATVSKLSKVDGRALVGLSSGESIECDKVLMGVGVAPNSDGIGLEALGVKTTRGLVDVDEHMGTNVAGIHAIGDVTGKLPLAHVASAQGIAAVEAIAGKCPAPLDYTAMPRATYCQPQVASLGLTEKAALDRGLKVKVSKFPFTANGKAVALGRAEGFVKLVAEARSGEILGAHLIGHDVTDLLAEVSMTRSLEGSAVELGRTVHAHPTLSEALMEAGLGVLGQHINT